MSKLMPLFAGAIILSLPAISLATPNDALTDMTLHVIPQSHIDLAWWWRYDPETLDVVAVHTLETAFANFDSFPDYTFTYLQVPAIAPLETRYPQLFYKLRYYSHRPEPVRDGIPNPLVRGSRGRLAIGSGLWCEVDAGMLCGESLVRQCMYGKRYFSDNFGVDVKTAWFQDAWTHPWTYPQILKKSGMDSYMFTRPRGEGESLFWWEGPDGSRVLAYKPLEGDGDKLPDQAALDARLRMMHEKYGVNDDIVLVGVGNHGGGAMRADVERMRRVMAQRSTADENKPPQMKFSTPARFVEAILREPHDLPVVTTELEPTLRGAYTTVGEIKRGNRQCENLLMTAEKFSAIAAWLKLRPYPREIVNAAWRKVMLNQFHDTISGTDVVPATEDALRLYGEVRESIGGQLDQTLKAICAHIDTKGRGTPVVVFNPLAWDRTDLVEAELEWEKGAGAQLTDDQGQEIPVQLVEDKNQSAKGTLRFVFVAESVPSVGYRTYWVRPDRSSDKNEAGEFELENEFFRVIVDATSGCLARVYDKQQRRDVISEDGMGNLIQVIEDFGDSEGYLMTREGKIEHNVWDGQCWNVDSSPEIKWVERGPVRYCIQVKKTYGLARFTQRISLSPKIPRVDFELVMDWEGQNKMVKVAFPLAVSAPDAAYEIPYGAISRASVGEECTAQNWVDVSNRDYGVSLLNDGRYGHDINRNTIRLSVLRSPDKPVMATDERGTHMIRYSLYPHAGSWKDAGTVQRGMEFNTPLIAVAADTHTGNLPSRYSFLRMQPQNVLLNVLKMAENADDLILRYYESTGSACTARVNFAPALAFDAVCATDLLEKSTAAVPARDRGFESSVNAWSIDTYKIIRD